MKHHFSLQPFVHLFHSDGQNYAYDVNSNQILAIEPVLAAVLQLYGKISPTEVVRSLDHEFPSEEILEAISAIFQAQRDEELFRGRKVKLVPPGSDHGQPRQCDTNLRHLVLTVTERCNLRCTYCLHGAELDGVRPHGNRDIELERGKKAIQFFLDRADPERQGFAMPFRCGPQVSSQRG